MQEPRIMLADEPIASLDPRNATVVMDALRAINREEGITVVCNLHTLDIARSYCDRIVGMARGAVVFDGRPDELTTAAARASSGVDGQHDAQRLSVPPTDRKSDVLGTKWSGSVDHSGRGHLNTTTNTTQGK